MSLQQVQIDGRVLQSLMSHQQLNAAQHCTSFDQMRGEAMHKHDHTEIRYHSYYYLNRRGAWNRSAIAKWS